MQTVQNFVVGHYPEFSKYCCAQLKFDEYQKRLVTNFIPLKLKPVTIITCFISPLKTLDLPQILQFIVHIWCLWAKCVSTSFRKKC